MKDNDKISCIDFKSKKTDKVKARKLVAEIVNRHSHNISFSRHALDELEKDELTTLDAWNVLKSTSSKILNEGELEKGSFRYRLQTNFIMLVIAFWPDGKGLIIVTAWDKRKKGRK
jgi:hypothetical protein